MKQLQGEQSGAGEETFEDFMREARDQFVKAIIEQKWDNDMRMVAEDILVAYDQMRERLASHPVQSVKQGQAEPQDMTADEFYNSGLFNLNFLNDWEKETIYRATELYAKGKVRVALSSPAPPQTSGAVWVEASDRLPERTDEVHWRFGNTKQSISPINIKFVFDNNLRNLWSEYQWLDESSGDKDSEREKLLAFQRLQAKNNDQMVDELCEKSKEIERLKGLIKKAHSKGWLDYPIDDSDEETIETSFEKFKSENNL